MANSTAKSSQSTLNQQVPSGYVSKRQYNVAMQALELSEGELEARREKEVLQNWLIQSYQFREEWRPFNERRREKVQELLK